MKEIVLDFRRYKGLGFSVRESIDIARTRRRARQALAQHQRAPGQPRAQSSTK